MGSFDYSDDYSSFDNLLNRTTLLTEGGRGLGGYHSGFGRTLTSRLKDAGSEAFTRDSRKFVVHILYGANILTDEEESMLRSAGPAGGKNYRLALVQILDNHKDEIIERADEISDAIEERFPALANEILGRDPERIKNNISKRKVKLASNEIQRGIKSGEDPVDVITDEMEKVLANAAVYTALTNAQRKVSDRSLDAVEKYAIEYVNSFSDLDKLINNLKTKFDNEDFNMLADELSNSLSSIRSNAGIGEDNEDPYRGVNDPGDSENSYEGGLAGQDISEIEDEEDVISRESLNNNMRKRKLLFEKKKKWGKFRSNRRQKLVVEKRLTAAKRRRMDDSEFALPGKGKGPEGKQAGAYPINDEAHAINALARVAQHGTPEEKKKVRAAVARKFPDIKQEEEEVRADLQQGPMLDSYQSDTSGYLSEQVTKDKRYKRPEVKNQSFKEKYKPKTHWQLEELRRMGL
jgi:hypothetical protein